TPGWPQMLLRDLLPSTAFSCDFPPQENFPRHARPRLMCPVRRTPRGGWVRKIRSAAARHPCSRTEGGSDERRRPAAGGGDVGFPPPESGGDSRSPTCSPQVSVAEWITPRRRRPGRAENVAADAGSATVAIPQPTIAPTRIVRLCAREA